MKKASKIITGFNKGEYKALIKDLYIEDARLTKQKNRYITSNIYETFVYLSI